jgi:hypothetical protein
MTSSIDSCLLLIGLEVIDLPGLVHLYLCRERTSQL